MSQLKEMTMTFRAGAAPRLALLAVILTGAATGASAQEIYSGLYPQQTGEAIYKGVCQGCHMPDAKGAIGAGAYPALAGDRNLKSTVYIAATIINGRKAMPSFGDGFTDAQIANVINYVRSSFGNHFPGSVTPDEVKALRPAAGK